VFIVSRWFIQAVVDCYRVTVWCAVLLFLKSAMAAARLGGPESLYRGGKLESLTQRHSADLVHRRRKTRSLSSRFADVLSLECGSSSLSRVMNCCDALPAVDPPQSDCGALLSLRRQLSLAANTSEPLLLTTSRLVPQRRTPGIFPSSPLLAPITAQVGQLQLQGSDQLTVSVLVDTCQLSCS